MIKNEDQLQSALFLRCHNLSPAQKELHSVWRGGGIEVVVFNDLDKAFDYVKNIVSLTHG